MKKIKPKSISSSLRYPKINLLSCLEKIQILFDKNSTNSITTNTIILDVGYSLKSSYSSSFLASLKYYKLIEKTKDNNYKISDFIIDYCINKTLKKENIIESLNSVPINKKIFLNYDIDNLPSDNELKSFLIKECNYSIKDVDTYLKIFQSNLLLYKESFEDEGNLDEKTTRQHKNKILINEEAQIEDVVYNNPLSNGKNITIKLPNNIKNLNINDLEETLEFLNFVLNKIEKELNLKKD